MHWEVIKNAIFKVLFLFYLEISFQFVSSTQINSDADFKKIQDAIKTHQSDMPLNSKIYKIFRNSNSTSSAYRIVYELPNGYS